MRLFVAKRTCEVNLRLRPRCLHNDFWNTEKKSIQYALHGFVLSAYRVRCRPGGRLGSSCAIQSARRAERLGSRDLPGSPQRTDARYSQSQAAESGLVRGISSLFPEDPFPCLII